MRARRGGGSPRRTVRGEKEASGRGGCAREGGGGAPPVGRSGVKRGPRGGVVGAGWAFAGTPSPTAPSARRAAASLGSRARLAASRIGGLCFVPAVNSAFASAQSVTGFRSSF